MVREPSQDGNGDRVRLSKRDWVGVSGGMVGLVTLIMSTYMQVERSLVSLSINMDHQQDRIEQLQRDVERLEQRLFGEQ